MELRWYSVGACTVGRRRCGGGVPPPAPKPTPPPFNRRAPSYCFVEPNIDCYPNTSGRPGCCWDDGGSYCPSFQPGCQAQPIVMEYCTYFDYNCYPQDGKLSILLLPRRRDGMSVPEASLPTSAQPAWTKLLYLGFRLLLLPSIRQTPMLL